MIYSYLRNITLFVFIFSLPFYTWGKMGITESISLPHVIAMIYTGISLVNFRKSLNLTQIKAYIYPLAFLLVWMFISSLIRYFKTLNDEALFHFSFFQFVLLLAIIINHLKLRQKFIYTALLVYVSSVILLSVLLSLGIGTEVVGGRVKIFGDNQNQIAIRATFGCVIILGIIINPEIKTKWKYLSLITLPPFFFIFIETASVGALVAFVFSLSTLVIFSKISLWKKTLILILLGLIIIPFYLIMGNNLLLLNRLIVILGEGDELRKSIFMGFLKGSLQHPLIGNGTNGYLAISRATFGEIISPHNWFLYTFITGGLIGLSAFVLFHFRVLMTGVHSIKLENNPIPLALNVAVLIHILKSGSELTDVSIWFILAVIIAWSIKEKEDIQY